MSYEQPLIERRQDVRVSARGDVIVRVRGMSLAGIIELAALAESLATLLADAIARSRIAPTEVMVVDRDRARRAQVSEAFRVEGCHVIEASTPIEAIDALTDASFATELIAVADTAPASVGEELRDYLDTAYASALVVGIGDPEWIPTRTQLDPSDTEGLLRAHVRSLLRLAPIRRSLEDVAGS